MDTLKAEKEVFIDVQRLHEDLAQIIQSWFSEFLTFMQKKHILADTLYLARSRTTETKKKVSVFRTLWDPRTVDQVFMDYVFVSSFAGIGAHKVLGSQWYLKHGISCAKVCYASRNTVVLSLVNSVWMSFMHEKRQGLLPEFSLFLFGSSISSLPFAWNYDNIS